MQVALSITYSHDLADIAIITTLELARSRYTGITSICNTVTSFLDRPIFVLPPTFIFSEHFLHERAKTTSYDSVVDYRFIKLRHSLFVIEFTVFNQKFGCLMKCKTKWLDTICVPIPLACTGVMQIPQASRHASI